MGELINGRSPEEIKRILSLESFDCSNIDCPDCEYIDICKRVSVEDCAGNALALIERLESERDAALAKVPKWISVKERLPEEKESVLVHYADGWMPIAFLLGGKWYQNSGDTSWLSVTHWMYMPEPQKEGE